MDKQRDVALKAACFANGASAECSARYADLKVAQESYAGKTESAKTLIENGLYEYSNAVELESMKPLLNVPHYDAEGIKKMADVIRFVGNLSADSAPGLGDVKAFYEAEDGLDYSIAVLGIIPGAGDLAAKLIKEGRVLFAAGDAAGAAVKLKEANLALHGVDINTSAVAERLATLKATPEVKNVYVVEAGSKGNWSKMANGKLDADSAYVLSNGDSYTTDTAGRIKGVEGELSATTMDRNTYQQLCAGKSGCVGDDGGHMIASSLGGAGDRINMVPQASTLNRGDWKAMENELRDFVNAGKTVTVKIEVGYPAGGGVRPSEFRVIQTIDGILQRPKIFTQ